ncbi:unnamed protein product [Polarella glacialis]|uniref:Protein kinase domain-containing protein n=1 Tax=Polarella glacialis TaxID=89957 RepID=A0A813HUB2_POLGL|nr:unnamed protein product [Polarella glacialis]CAE8683673.1 unnamed protein product [Polarella glacialis]
MAPEVIRCAEASGPEHTAQRRSGYGRAADWWSLGVLLFELLAGTAPFGYHEDVSLEGQQLLHKQEAAASEGLPWPAPQSSASGGAPLEPSVEAKAAAVDLMQVDQRCRLGANRGLEELKAHPFFASAALDWESLAGSSAKGPAFDTSLGQTVEAATASPCRPRRRGAAMGLHQAAEEPDPFLDF